jgi:hypothetical protein
MLYVVFVLWWFDLRICLSPGEGTELGFIYQVTSISFYGALTIRMVAIGQSWMREILESIIVSLL